MNYVTAASRLSRVGAVFVAVVGVTVLVGWSLDVPRLTGVLPGLATMKVNTALSFLVAAVALWYLAPSTPGPPSVHLARGLGAVVAGLGVLTLSEDLFGFDLHIDQLIFPDGPGAATSLHPGRMSPASAVNFALIGAALVGLKLPYPWIAARAHWLAVPPLFVATLAIAGYAYGITSLYEVHLYNSMALHTAVAFVVLTLSILAADPTHGIMSIATSDTAGGVVARRLIPTIPLLLFGLGWLCLTGNDMGLYNAYFGLALMVVLSIAVCVHAVASTAVVLHAVDLKRQIAEAEILAHVSQLHGLLPICAWCKKIRDDHDYWQSVEQYVTARTDVRFSHDICPECQAKVLAEGAAATQD